MPNPFFLVGCQKCATTWIHHALREHPDVQLAAEDELHFFDIHWERGRAYYERQYAGLPDRPCRGDTTSSYARDRRVPARIASWFPDARILIAAREPVSRAFSHYWHEKKKGKYTFTFEEVFSNYDLYDSWIATGFYVEHVKSFRRHFPADRVRVVLMEDLAADPGRFFADLCVYLGIDPSFRPSCLHERINVAPPGVGGQPGEYSAGLAPQLRRHFQRVFAPYNRELAELTGLDLAAWQRTPTATPAAA